MSLTKSVKVVICGQSNVGKSSIVYSLINGKSTTNINSTVCASFYRKQVSRSDQLININIWDTAGQERYYAITPIYFRNANYIIFVFDITNFESYQKVANWILLANNSKNDELPIYILIANKIDKHCRDINNETIKHFCTLHNIKYYIETSAITGEGITDLLNTIADDVIKDDNLEFFKSILNSQKLTLKTLSENNSNSYCTC